MKNLQARLYSAGFLNITFCIINSKLAINETEGINTLKDIAEDIPVLQEPPEGMSNGWHAILEGGIDHILVLDRCGRLAFQVISPWSLLTYPYVKASILSTYFDNPCGPCHISVLEEPSIHEEGIETTTNDNYEEIEPTITSEAKSIHDDNEISEANQENSKMGPTEEEIQTEGSNSQDLEQQGEYDPGATLSPLIERRDGTVPIKVIMHAPHIHNENGMISEHLYIVQQTGNPTYHGHLEETEIPLQKISDTTPIPILKNNENKTVEAIDENSIGHATSIMKNKGKKNHKTKASAEEISTEHATTPTPLLKNKGKKTHNKTKAAADENSMEPDTIPAQILQNKGKKTQTADENSMEHVQQHNHSEWKKKNSNEDETNTEIPQDIRQHGTYINTVYNGTHDHHKSNNKYNKYLKKQKYHHINVTESISDTKPVQKVSASPENGTIEIITMVEIQKKRPGTKKHEIDQGEDQNNTNFYTSNNSEEQIPVETNDIEEQRNSTEIRVSEEVSVNGNTTEEPSSTSSDEEGEVRGEDLIKHYSKLLKWTDYQL